MTPRPSRASLGPSQPGGSAVVRAMPLAGSDDAVLARALAHRHPGAAEVAWDRFAPRVRRLLRRTLGPGDEIDDHVQEVFFRLFGAARDLRDPELLGSFVVGVTMRVARLELRRRRLRRWLRLAPTSEPPSEPVSEVDPAGRQAVGRLYALLDRVGDEARVLFTLRHVEGLELTEIAAAIGCSLATAKRRLAKASRRILALAEREPSLREYLEAGTNRSEEAP